ncbi:MAG: nucleotidyltransferase [Clostridia bacterium]|nr:nucleotidyltransferase [Clostridia bacterium]
MDTTLVVMAAGMGSRFGGLKQIAPMGTNGEIILDFSVYDAVKAGFNKAVFIIKKEIEHDFREVAGKRIEKMIDTEYVFQHTDTMLPEGFSVPADRAKPWGTGHAILCAKNAVTTPFAAINADDYYGKSAFKLVHDALTSGSEICLAAFRLGNTLTENGTVSRGVCDIKDGLLKSVVEHTALDKNSPIPMDTPVSMNMWGFKTDIFAELETRFAEFLKNMTNPCKDEFFLPFVVDELIKNNGTKVDAYISNDKWYGVTYKDDTPAVQSALQNLMKEGHYDGI